MKIFFILLSFFTLFLFSGCGSSLSIDTPENISRSKPKELFITLPKELYYVGEKFDNSFKATDEYDRDITDEVLVEGEVDTSQVGSYDLLYKLVENSEIVSSIEKTILVKINQYLKSYSMEIKR